MTTIDQIDKAFETWKKQGRTEEQIWAVQNFLTGAGEKGIAAALEKVEKETREADTAAVEDIEIERAHTYASENADIYRAHDRGEQDMKDRILATLKPLNQQ